MDDATPRLPVEPSIGSNDLEETLKIQVVSPRRRTSVLDKPVERPLLPTTAASIAETQSASSTHTTAISDGQAEVSTQEYATVAFHQQPSLQEIPPVDEQPDAGSQEVGVQEAEEVVSASATEHKHSEQARKQESEQAMFDPPAAGATLDTEQDQVAAGMTLKLPAESPSADAAAARHVFQDKAVSSRWQAVLFIVLLCILVFQATNLSFAQFIGSQGWSFVLNGPDNASNANLIKELNQQLHNTTKPTSGTTATPMPLTPRQYIDLIMQRMTLNQKLGQLMLVQFIGPGYSPDLSTMISQYDVGAVLIFAANNNIESKPQLKGLIQQMQNNSSIPLVVSIDQEGGTVDRLAHLDGTRPSAAAIGATSDPHRAWEEGVQDAKDLSSYGINLNLAPVVDVTNVFSQQLYLRTFGNNPTLVTKMASAYLQGLQQSKKVLGTLKHFPGLGDVASDPHITVPYLNRSESQLEAIDWAPYRALIAQGNVYSVMVTHEIVQAVDSSKPSSLSYKLVTGILRDKLGFQGVIVTDSLTMEGITAYYTEAQAAVLAVEAGDDLLMGASTPADVATMVEGLKQAVNSGEISQQRIDDSVRRILMLKYQMGLLPLPTS